MENNNMSNEEKLAKFLEEIRKLGNIRLDGETSSAEKKSIDQQAGEVFEAMSRVGINTAREAEKMVKKMVDKQTKGTSSSDDTSAKAQSIGKDDIMELLYREYGSGDSKVGALLEELVPCEDKAERVKTARKAEKAAEAEAKAAFMAGFEAAKQLFR